MAHSDEKPGGYSRSSGAFTCFVTDSRTAWIEEVRKSFGSQLQRYNNIYNALWPIFVKLASDFKAAATDVT